MFTLAQAAERLNVSIKTVRREIADGRLKVTPVRGCDRIDQLDLESYKREQRRAREETRCQSVAMEKDGKSAFSLPGSALAKLLGIAATPSSSNESSGEGSPIVSLEERRATRSRKPSHAG